MKTVLGYLHIKRCNRALIILIFVSLLPVGCGASSLYFVSCKPPVGGDPLGPHIATLYKYDENTDTLEKTWALDNNKWVDDVRHYPDLNLLIIGYNEQYNSYKTDHLVVIPCDTLSKRSYYEVEEDYKILNYHLLQSNDNRYLEMNITKGRTPFEKAYLNLESKKYVDNKALSSDFNYRLAGPATRFYGSEHDILGSKISDSGLMSFPRTNYPSISESVPDSVRRMKDSRIYNLLINEEKYFIFYSTPYESAIKQRELLFYNTLDSTWESLLIDGDFTSLVYINGWLIGNVIYSDMNFNWGRRYGGEIVTKKLAMVNTDDLQSYYIELDGIAEPIWINDNKDVYYRIDNVLYKARFENNDFVDKRVITKAPFASGIHWAFRGSMGE